MAGRLHPPPLLLLIVLVSLLCEHPARAGTCTPEAVQQLRQRGLSPQAIEQICGGQTSAPHRAQVCVTQFGSCPFEGPVNAPCTCKTQFGVMRGVSR